MSLSVHCPECHTPLEVDEKHRDWKVRCPQCRHEFRPLDAASAPGAFEGVADGEEPAPRQRRRRRRRDDDSGDPEAGEREIVRPASALELTAWISLLLILAISVLLVILGIVQGNQPPPQQQPKEDPPELFIFMGVCLGIFSVPYFIAIAYGARKARNLSSQSWGVAAGVMSVAAIVLVGICGLPIIIPGIWLIVALNNDDVKAAFKRKKRRLQRDDRDDQDEEDDR